MENLQSGDITHLEEEEFLTTRQRAVQVETEYHESIENYKTASWLNPIKKVKQKVEVREKKRLTRRYNHSLRSLNESMHSGSDTSSTVASSGSPPGSNLAADDIQAWAYSVAGESEDDSDGYDYSPLSAGHHSRYIPPDSERNCQITTLSPGGGGRRMSGTWEVEPGLDGSKVTVAGVPGGDVIDAFGTLNISDH
ncbi:hypothetical protein B0H16DRAFT_1405566, partial [Mycena metata]